MCGTWSRGCSLVVALVARDAEVRSRTSNAWIYLMLRKSRGYAVWESQLYHWSPCTGKLILLFTFGYLPFCCQCASIKDFDTLWFYICVMKMVTQKLGSQAGSLRKRSSSGVISHGRRFPLPSQGSGQRDRRWQLEHKEITCSLRSQNHRWIWSGMRVTLLSTNSRSGVETPNKRHLVSEVSCVHVASSIWKRKLVKINQK